MQESDQPPSDDGDSELEARMLTVVKATMPILRVAKNTTKVLHRLSSVGADTFVAALEAGASWFDLQKSRNQLLIAQLAELPAKQSLIGAKMAERLIEEQRRIDQLVFAAIERLQASGHASSAEEGKVEEGGDEIDDDWIESFRREAADRSQGEMKEAFTRILAGEIQEPGSFSIRTLRTVGALSQSTAHLFRKAASLRVGMEIVAADADSRPRRHILDARIPSLGGKLGDNHLMDQGLDYSRLIELTESGLLHPEYNSWHDYDLAVFSQQNPLKNTVIPVVHQDQEWTLIPLPNFKMPGQFKIHGAKFTTVGQELLQIVDIERDPEFLDRVRTYFKSQHLEMAALSSRMT